MIYLLLLLQATPTMSHQLAQIVVDNAGVIVIAGSAAVALLIRTIAKRIASKQVNAARLEAAEAKRNVDRVENEGLLEREKTKAQIELLRLEVEKNRIDASAYEAAQKTIQEQLTFLSRQTDVLQAHGNALADFGKVLSSDSAVLAGNTEALGDLGQQFGGLVKQIEDVSRRVDDLGKQVSTVSADVKRELHELSTHTRALSEKVNTLLEETGEQIAIVEPLDTTDKPAAA